MNLHEVITKSLGVRLYVHKDGDEGYPEPLGDGRRCSFAALVSAGAVKEIGSP